MSPYILGLGGSLRDGSSTSLALSIALAGAQAAGAQTKLFDLRAIRLPLFDGSYSLDGYTDAERESIARLFEAVIGADGIILASPTYHNTISGALKNALDLLEAIEGEDSAALKDKVVGLLTVQGGTSGTGNNTLTTMLLAARAMHAWVAPTMVSVPGSRSAFGDDGLPQNSAIRTRLMALGAEVARASAMFTTHWTAE